MTKDRKVTWGHFYADDPTPRHGGHAFDTVEESIVKLSSCWWSSMKDIQKEALTFLLKNRTLTEQALYKRRNSDS